MAKVKKKARIDERFDKKSEIELMSSADPRERIVGVGRMIHGTDWISPMARSLDIARQTLVDWITDERRAKHVWPTIDTALERIIDLENMTFQEEASRKAALFAEAKALFVVRGGRVPRSPKGGK